MYVQMLCGLYHRLSVLRAGAVFASGFLRAIRFLQMHYQSLAHDIATGTLSPSITDLSLRRSVSDLLRPDPDLAELILRECSNPNWSAIIPRLWPNTKYLDVVITGAMAQYLPTLEFYSGGLPVASTMYASSECYFGINLRPMCPPSEVVYTILPNMGYFEFIPVNGGQPVELADVVLGKEYEMVVTTYAGLCRYRVGDVLRMAGFRNAAPQFEFVRRKNVVLSIESDKTDEAELHGAVQSAAELLRPFGMRVVEYTSQAYTKSIPGRYVIYWELLAVGDEKEKKSVDGEVMQSCCLAMEEKLNSVYRQSRVADRSIGPLEIRVVRGGTFEELMDDAISRGASINQYKVPRCVCFPPILELLDSRVVSTHFSPGLPHWRPLQFN
ncbi:hypothetical protein HPP92_012940 [Vanilla planifolia]|uniref:Uncharacterized protein n=1 Tax=Vanilla planifolia TaxID=51239 RepID=A0A835QRG3_VANPL|nr:hypothetical protein HPP92_012940 [Vanilla planifolia]